MTTVGTRDEELMTKQQADRRHWIDKTASHREGVGIDAWVGA